MTSFRESAWNIHWYQGWLFSSRDLLSQSCLRHPEPANRCPEIMAAAFDWMSMSTWWSCRSVSSIKKGMSSKGWRRRTSRFSKIIRRRTSRFSNTKISRSVSDWSSTPAEACATRKKECTAPRYPSCAPAIRTMRPLSLPLTIRPGSSRILREASEILSMPSMVSTLVSRPRCLTPSICRSITSKRDGWTKRLCWWFPTARIPPASGASTKSSSTSSRPRTSPSTPSES